MEKCPAADELSAKWSLAAGSRKEMAVVQKRAQMKDLAGTKHSLMEGRTSRMGVQVHQKFPPK